ncbi:ALF repeat-containing protein [Streptomyces sp. NPDC029216]|uniref:ALF repeat-containing protein n=1 Tax=Streptomyces sp. NPDC029216 TaxID=3154701 RepID=UPI0033D1568A
MERAARDAETARIAEDTAMGVEEARLRAQAETEEIARAARERTQADRTTTDIKDLVAAASEALRAGDLAAAVTAGRKAAVRLLDSPGTWTRDAAEFALAGGEEDVVNWIDTDRLLAERQDDRETVLAMAATAGSEVAAAAHRALASDDPNAARDFLTRGVIEASATQNRVMVFELLHQNPGSNVKAKAEAALADGSAAALHRFLTVELADAVKVDDQAQVFALLSSGGPYMKSAAQIVLEGPAYMRRNFILQDSFDIARLDQDHATHVSAIRASIAHAAKVAANALEEAALASKAAAEARQAAADASQWASKAQGYAADATTAAREAKTNADAADASAAEAAKSAASAKQAASAAQVASRSANYSMRQAMASARQAASSSSSAQANASQARASALQASQDARAAADAATAARQTAEAKQRAEAIARAKQAAEEARRNEANGTHPSQTAANDTPWYVDSGLWPADTGSDKDWAKVTKHWSTLAGTASLTATVSGFIPTPASPFLLGAGGVLAGVSVGLKGVSAYFTGQAYGWDSSKFHTSLGLFALGGIFLGKSHFLEKSGLAHTVGGKITHVTGEAVTTVIGLLKW